MMGYRDVQKCNVEGCGTGNSGMQNMGTYIMKKDDLDGDLDATK